MKYRTKGSLRLMCAVLSGSQFNICAHNSLTIIKDLMRHEADVSQTYMPFNLWKMFSNKSEKSESSE